MIPVALTVAGSDPSGGAGIQADLKTFSAFKVYGMSVVTAVTAQNTMRVARVVELSPDLVDEQWDAVMTDVPAGAVKTGLLPTGAIVEVLAKKVQQYGTSQLVIDPVMVSTSGAPLVQSDAIRYLKYGLLPLALVVTPNLQEACVLSGFEVNGPQRMEDAARRIRDMGPKYVLVKGGHAGGEDAMDVLFDGNAFSYYHAPRAAKETVHGAGCVLSAAITACLARGNGVEDAVRIAKDFVTHAIRRRLQIGKGSCPVDPVGVESI